MTEGIKKMLKLHIENEIDLLPENQKRVLNYITNLQNEKDCLQRNYDDNEQAIKKIMEELEEYRQMIKMQNEREYRSKFLKDFQKEHGENVFPDYDEVYKRYDDYKLKNKNYKERIAYLNTKINNQKGEINNLWNRLEKIKKRHEYLKCDLRKERLRNENAVEYIGQNIYEITARFDGGKQLKNGELDDLLNILQGGNE